MPSLRAIDVFAGCGGLSLGFERSGAFDIVHAVEHDRSAAQSYEVNFAVDVDHRSIEEIRSFPAADVVVGGPPCQGFSALNRQGVGPERRALWRQYVRVLKTSGARSFVMENVPQLLISGEFTDFRAEATGMGFQIVEGVLNAADYGVPQTRKRAIVIGTMDATPHLPSPTHTPVADLAGSRRWRTFRDAVRELPLTPDGVNWHVARNPWEISRARYARVPPDGGNRFQMQEALESEGLGHLIPPCWRKKTVGTTDVFGRLWWDRPAVTLRTEFTKPEKGRYLHPSENRAITLREGARCMTFPDEFTFPSDQSATAVSRQIGNAVPPLLAEHIARALVQALEGHGDTETARAA